jgi:hypothetical protein
MDPETQLYQEICQVVKNARQRVFRVANSALLESYWEIERIIIEDEQRGAERASYGMETLKRLSGQLTLEFGRGFDESNLRNMCSFYNIFPIRDSLRHELSWSHYRILIRLDSKRRRVKSTYRTRSASIQAEEIKINGYL